MFEIFNLIFQLQQHMQFYVLLFLFFFNKIP